MLLSYLNLCPHGQAVVLIVRKGKEIREGEREGGREGGRKEGN